MTSLQTELLHCLQLAVQGKPHPRIVYTSEWLGYLPFGLYHWVEIDGQDISLSLPSEWERSDLEALVKAGSLVKIEESKNPNDEFQTKITYEVTMTGRVATEDRPCE